MLAVRIDPVDLPQRPQCRSECSDGPRPCPWIGCRYHLLVDLDPRTGRIIWNQPGILYWPEGADEPVFNPEMISDSCALDVAERSPQTLLRIGRLLGITKERTRQIEKSILGTLRRRRKGLHGLRDHAFIHVQERPVTRSL